MSNKRKLEDETADELEEQPLIKKIKASQITPCMNPDCAHDEHCPNVLEIVCGQDHMICAKCLLRGFQEGATWTGWDFEVKTECPACKDRNDGTQFTILSNFEDVSRMNIQWVKPLDTHEIFPCCLPGCTFQGTLSQLNLHIVDQEHKKACAGWRIQCEHCKTWLNMLKGEHFKHGAVCPKRALDESLAEFKQAAEKFDMSVFDGPYQQCAKEFREMMPKMLKSMASALQEPKDPKRVMNFMRGLADGLQCAESDHFTATSRFLSAQAKKELGLPDIPFPALPPLPSLATNSTSSNGNNMFIQQTTTVLHTN